MISARQLAFHIVGHQLVHLLSIHIDGHHFHLVVVLVTREQIQKTLCEKKERLVFPLKFEFHAIIGLRCDWLVPGRKKSRKTPVKRTCTFAMKQLCAGYCPVSGACVDENQLIPTLETSQV